MTTITKSDTAAELIAKTTEGWTGKASTWVGRWNGAYAECTETYRNTNKTGERIIVMRWITEAERDGETFAPGTVVTQHVKGDGWRGPKFVRFWEVVEHLTDAERDALIERTAAKVAKLEAVYGPEAVAARRLRDLALGAR